MRPGELKHQITIERLSGATSLSGEEAQVWVTFLSGVWAAVETLTGREQYAQSADQMISELTHKVRIRYVAGILPKMRVLHRSRYFDILSVKNLMERDEEIHLMCKEAVISHGT